MVKEIERRRHERAQVQIPVHLHLEGKTYPMETRDISESGLFVIARLRKIPCECLQNASLELLTEKLDLKMTGKIVRIQDSSGPAREFLSGFAISFESIAPEAREAYQQILEKSRI